MSAKHLYLTGETADIGDRVTRSGEDVVGGLGTIIELMDKDNIVFVVWDGSPCQEGTNTQRLTLVEKFDADPVIPPPDPLPNMSDSQKFRLAADAIDGDEGAREVLANAAETYMERLGLGPNAKDSNPKDAVGIAKAYASTIPRPVLWEIGLAMLEGALKYGRHNYRKAGVRASVYFDASCRHLDSWWEGEDIDPDSGLSHITKAIAGLIVLRDAMMNDMWTDDRPPRTSNPKWLAQMNDHAKMLLEKYPPDARKAPFTNVEHGAVGETKE